MIEHYIYKLVSYLLQNRLSIVTDRILENGSKSHIFIILGSDIKSLSCDTQKIPVSLVAIYKHIYNFLQ